MKVSTTKSLLGAVALAVLPAMAFADTCSNYVDLIRRKTSDYTAAMSHTTDSMERQILTEAYEATVDGLKLEMASFGCSTDALPLPPAAPPVDPGTGPTDPTLPPDNPPTDPTLPPDNPTDPTLPPDNPPTDPTDNPGEDPTDPTLPPDDGGDDNTPLPDNSACAEQLDSYAEVLRSQGVHQNVFVALMKKKSYELGCGSYGCWRSHYVKQCHRKKVELKKKCDLKKKVVCKPAPKKCGGH